MHCSLYAEAWLPDSHLCMHVNYYILNTQKKKTQSFRYLEVFVHVQGRKIEKILQWYRIGWYNLVED